MIIWNRMIQNKKHVDCRVRKHPRECTPVCQPTFRSSDITSPDVLRLAFVLEGTTLDPPAVTRGDSDNHFSELS
jgi:hypothetical protein